MTTDPYTPDETELRDCYAASLHEHDGEDYATAKADAVPALPAQPPPAHETTTGQQSGTALHLGSQPPRLGDHTTPKMVSTKNNIKAAYGRLF